MKHNYIEVFICEQVDSTKGLVREPSNLALIYVIKKHKPHPTAHKLIVNTFFTNMLYIVLGDKSIEPSKYHPQFAIGQ